MSPIRCISFNTYSLTVSVVSIVSSLLLSSTVSASSAESMSGAVSSPLSFLEYAFFVCEFLLILPLISFTKASSLFSFVIDSGATLYAMSR